MMKTWVCLAVLLIHMGGWAAEPTATKDLTPFILTPKPGPEPRINGPSVFGVRPKNPFLYRIPATGERPMTFSAEGLPKGLNLDAATGQITGSIKRAGEYKVVLKASNARGESRKNFRIVAGEEILLTPPMGWMSFYSYCMEVNQEKMLRAVRAMARSGLIDHGWSYVNIGGFWAGERKGKDLAMQANPKLFPDMKALCDEIHGLGLKAGIYSTPWIADYAGYPGTSSNRPDGAWNLAVDGDPKNRAKFTTFGKYSFTKADVRLWARWGFDFMMYDWYPSDMPHVIEMGKALRACGRDIAYSVSNKAPIELAPELMKWANTLRISGDICDAWQGSEVVVPQWSYSLSEVLFMQDRWAPFAGPGHWIDTDCLQVGVLFMGDMHPGPDASRLTPNQQYSLVSMLCMLSAFLQIGGDLEKLDAFTLNLLTNDEVLAIHQDSLGVMATRVAVDGPVDIYKKPLEDGTVALGFFNRSPAAHRMAFNKLIDIGLEGKFHVRDLWRQQDLSDVSDIVDVPDHFVATIPAHGVLLVKMTKVETVAGPEKK